jgi:hypothetical protein
MRIMYSHSKTIRWAELLEEPSFGAGVTRKLYTKKGRLAVKAVRPSRCGEMQAFV